MSDIRHYVKKPVVIKAMQWDGTVESAMLIVEWVNSNYGDALYIPGRIMITTLEGLISASPLDYIIEGIEGEFYPCNPEIFNMTYSEV